MVDLVGFQIQKRVLVSLFSHGIGFALCLGWDKSVCSMGGGSLSAFVLLLRFSQVGLGIMSFIYLEIYWQSVMLSCCFLVWHFIVVLAYAVVLARETWWPQVVAVLFLRLVAHWRWPHLT